MTSPRVASLVVDVSVDGPRIPLSRAKVAAVVREVLDGEGVRNALVSIAFVTNARIASLNRKHLKRSGSTDVISFGFRRVTDDDPVVGDIYIAPAVARDSAAQMGVPEREELTRLIVHGTLHILGHDHPEDAARERSAMWTKQEGLVRRVMKTTSPKKRRAAKRPARKTVRKRSRGKR